MYAFKNHKKAFTLMELSVVIAIIGIMFTTILVARSLINFAKMNKIQEEYRSFSNAISQFQSIYDCLPGDCTQTQIADLGTGSYTTLFGSSGLCGTSPVSTAGADYSILGTVAIESATKRSCMMAELAAAGFLNSINTSTIAALTDLSVSTSGVNVPYAKFSQEAVWDYRVVTGNTANSAGQKSFPIINGSVLGWSTNSHQLVLHSSTDGEDIGFTTTTAVTYAVPSLLAAKLDLKFDDGLPYSGNISGARNKVDSAATATTSANYACTTVVGVEATNAATYNVYQKTNNVANGCLVSYLI